MEAQAQTNANTNTRYRAVWLSDIHLGCRDCKAELLLEALDSLPCETLYLLGDIIDLWALKRQLFWPASHQRVLDAFADLARNGTRVIYIPGNHDQPLRNYVEQSLFGVEVYRRFVHRTADGRRLLLLHGDEFDAATRYSRLLHLAGDTAYDFLLWLNRWSNRLRRWSGRPYWSLAGWLKGRVGKARQAIAAFEQAAAAAARAYPADGIVCGHIHQPARHTIDGILYCNDGDWIESCTALAEYADGRLALLHWTPEGMRERRSAAAADTTPPTTAGPVPALETADDPC